ncbi:NAD(+) diphosphatase [Phycicoccus sp. HDW14]|uniref:NAD(+) diphosphatase n=1 Tax=Phycicoccus sp. HDW14 TaxID=2714941 RepID=UPI00140929AF|nr:NAD(+) diphosphatase [Phycicoccus sp. HDW14]QIM20244.1 NAD(+) diphosphatase [Phycicoccus sp. HDW14]
MDRRGDLRSDSALLTRLLADPATRVFRLRGDAAEVVEDGHGGLRVVLGAPVPADADHLVVYLGESGGVHHLGVAEDLPDGGAPPEGMRTLRQVGARVDDIGASVFATTLALANWHRAHGFCPRCGGPTVPVLAGWVRRCRADDSEHYPRTDVAVIMAVVDDADRILLARGRGFTSRGMSVLAGFVEPGETLAAAVAREVFEEVGVEVTDVTYLGDQPWPFPSSLMVGFTARALGTRLRLQESEIAEARWFSREELVAAIADGSLVVPGGISIARRIVEHWFGGPVEAPEVASLR